MTNDFIHIALDTSLSESRWRVTNYNSQIHKLVSDWNNYMPSYKTTWQDMFTPINYNSQIHRLVSDMLHENIGEKEKEKENKKEKLRKQFEEHCNKLKKLEKEM
jgi:hypothetical protein